MLAACGCRATVAPRCLVASVDGGRLVTSTPLSHRVEDRGQRAIVLTMRAARSMYTMDTVDKTCGQKALNTPSACKVTRSSLAARHTHHEPHKTALPRDEHVRRLPLAQREPLLRSLVEFNTDQVLLRSLVEVNTDQVLLHSLVEVNTDQVLLQRLWHGDPIRHGEFCTRIETDLSIVAEMEQHRPALLLAHA